VTIAPRGDVLAIQKAQASFKAQSTSTEKRSSRPVKIHEPFGQAGSRKQTQALTACISATVRA
jgi:hypothetical protein